MLIASRWIFMDIIIIKGSLESQLFTRPNCLHQLAKFTLEAYCANVSLCAH